MKGSPRSRGGRAPVTLVAAGSPDRGSTRSPVQAATASSTASTPSPQACGLSTPRHLPTEPVRPSLPPGPPATRRSRTCFHRPEGPPLRAWATRPDRPHRLRCDPRGRVWPGDLTGRHGSAPDCRRRQRRAGSCAWENLGDEGVACRWGGSSGGSSPSTNAVVRRDQRTRLASPDGCGRRSSCRTPVRYDGHR